MLLLKSACWYCPTWIPLSQLRCLLALYRHAEAFRKDTLDVRTFDKVSVGMCRNMLSLQVNDPCLSYSLLSCPVICWIFDWKGAPTPLKSSLLMFHHLSNKRKVFMIIFTHGNGVKSIAKNSVARSSSKYLWVRRTGSQTYCRMVSTHT